MARTAVAVAARVPGSTPPLMTEEESLPLVRERGRPPSPRPYRRNLLCQRARIYRCVDSSRGSRHAFGNLDRAITLGKSDPRFGAQTAYDPATGQLVLFGGATGFGWPADTWTWNGSTWSELSPSTSSPPAGRYAAMAYDPATGQLVLFGCPYYGGPAYTFNWNGSAWIAQSPSSSPPCSACWPQWPTTPAPVSSFYSVAWTIAATSSLIPGPGAAPLGPSCFPRRARLLAKARRWPTTRLPVSSCFSAVETTQTLGRGMALLGPNCRRRPARPPRYGTSIAYDPDTLQLLLFGGCGSGCYLGDNWAWNGSTWTELSLSTSPSLRMEASMAYDPGKGQLVLFGGCYAGELGDTWTFGYPSSAVIDWTEQSPSTSPPARSDASMAYDPGTGQLVLFGGNDGSGPVADTWTWDGSSWTEQSPSTSPPAPQ